MKIDLAPEEFEQLRQLLSREAGLVFDESRRQSMGYSVAERMQQLGITEVAAYLARLVDAVERQRLIDEVTIPETHFFRNPPQQQALRRHVLPELIKHAEANGRRLRIWSAGCSTGEEPYSIAMMLRELLPTTTGWDVKILASDISQRALAAARTGRYGSRAVMLATPDELARFFIDGPDGTHDVRPEIKDLVEFRHHNLVTEPVPFPIQEKVDLVLCRNVTIYFARETTRALIARIHERLRDGGYLFLGHSETLWQVSSDFQLVALGQDDSAAFVYQRLDGLARQRKAGLPDRRAAEQPVVVERRSRVRKVMSPPRQLPPVEPALPDVPAMMATVRNCLARGNYAAAVTAAQQVSAIKPLLPEPFYLAGLAMVNAGNDQQALVQLRKAVYLDSSLGFAHFVLAGALSRLGDHAAAAREYGAAAVTLGLAPADATAPELGGRSVRELAALCRQLEMKFSGRQASGAEGVG